jgi:ubiquitin-conjugating enzyme E2 D/E
LNYKIDLISDDLFDWIVTLDGPTGTPFAGGKFKVHIDCRKEYPFKRPDITFETKIYSPNVTEDG